MKTTVNHSHKNSVINYLFFGIAASIFTLSIFFSYFQKEENVNIIKDMSYVINSRLTKPVSTAPITETYATNLKELFADTEAPLEIEAWMSQPFEVASTSSTAATVATTSALTIPTTFTENPIVVEEWMTDINSWTVASSNTFEEEVLRVESWMLSTSDWAGLSDNSGFASNEFAEEQLYIEAWMLDLNSWSKVFNDAGFDEAPLVIESWMLNTEDWIANAK
ncbi:MAG: hypothetical protein MI866_02805 [Bacteroidales bacterium]|nr:hypothetical protein [Bacteroidales bacterium]